MRHVKNGQLVCYGFSQGDIVGPENKLKIILTRRSDEEAQRWLNEDALATLCDCIVSIDRATNAPVTCLKCISKI